MKDNYKLSFILILLSILVIVSTVKNIKIGIEHKQLLEQQQEIIQGNEYIIQALLDKQHK